VGESFTVPEAFELDVTVRVEDPAVAVIVTPVAPVDCQVRVTLCPAVIEVVLAEKVRVGVALWPSPPQALIPHKASGRIPLEMQRNRL
jgi:hypothetical protein